MIHSTLQQEVRIYRAICDSVDRWAEREIDKWVKDRLHDYTWPEETMIVKTEEVPDFVDGILKQADAIKELYAQEMSFGRTFPGIMPDKIPYNDAGF